LWAAEKKLLGCRNCEGLVDIPTAIKQKYTLKKECNKTFEWIKKQRE
jgi:hypothetical protein